MLRVGEGTVDITPPLGIELAGFHRSQGNERRITGIRQKSAARALVLDVDGTQAAIVSIDMLGVSADFAKRVQSAAEQATGIPGANIRLCATHTHSMPTFRYLRQWGAISPEYMADVERKTVEAIQGAKDDLAEADCYVSRAPVDGGNSNRTAKNWKTEAEFTSESTDADRWLDTALHALYFQRSGGKTCPRWYHFSSHPVCYQDTEAGPDWPGLVAQRVIGPSGELPSLLQGHAGDVNPGDGTKWIGDPEPSAEAVAIALHHAIEHGEYVEADELRIANETVDIPFDPDRLREEMAYFDAHPEECVKDLWVDAAFAREWREGAAKLDLSKPGYTASVSAMRIGSLAFLFHPAELYSFYGLKVRYESPFPNTLCVGYCDDLIGYLTDPKAYDQNEYAAIVVPKITDLPPFTPSAARAFTERCVALLKGLA